MKTSFVEDGPSRLYGCEEFQTRLQELRVAIEARYAASIEEAGCFRRLVLRRRIAAEFRRERRKLYPSETSLYGTNKDEV